LLFDGKCLPTSGSEKKEDRKQYLLTKFGQKFYNLSETTRLIL